LVGEVGSDQVRFHLLWLKGLLAFARGMVEDSENSLEAAKAGFEAGDDLPNSALIAIDLAHVQLANGLSLEAQTLAREALPILSSLDLEQESMIALRIVEEALAASHLNIERVQLFWNRRKALFFNGIAPVAQAEERNRRAR